MKQLLFAGLIIAVAPFAVLAQIATPATTPAPQITLPDSGLVQGDFFYFFDRLGEGIDSFFTFRPESKARLALRHAQERASEVNMLLKKKGVDAPEVAQTKKEFDKELTLASSIVAEQKAKGKDVSEIAKEINDEFEVSKNMLKEAYQSYREDLKDAEKNLRKQLITAVQTGDKSAWTAIDVELQKLADKMMNALDEEGSIEDSFDDEKDSLDQAMGDKQSAESHIVNAERAYQALLQDMQARGIVLDQNIVASYLDMIKSAKEAFTAGNFETAKEDAKEAKNELREAGQERDTRDIEEDFFSGMNIDDQDEFEMMEDFDRQGMMESQDKNESNFRTNMRIQGNN